VKHVRNVAILVAIAIGVVALPGGGDAAAVTGAILSLLLVSLLAYFAGRFYRDHQIDIYGLGDADRAVLYLALGVIVIVLAGNSWLFDTTARTLVALVLLGAAGAGLLRVFRNWQRY